MRRAAYLGIQMCAERAIVMKTFFNSTKGCKVGRSLVVTVLNCLLLWALVQRCPRVKARALRTEDRCGVKEDGWPASTILTAR